MGATVTGPERCRFVVWAPFVEKVEVHLLSPEDRYVALERDEQGYHEVEVEGVPAGSTYLYRLDGGQERPDPVSRYQPESVHGPSAVVDPFRYEWGDGSWRGVPLDLLTIYELHVGTYTDEGTFDALVPHLDELVELGITAIELMPVNQFPGERNWGYDGVGLFAVQNSYGGPEGLRHLVDEAHQRGLAVLLDIVYNHLGPEGNYLAEFGPYMTDRYQTPWGPAINFDDSQSDDVRRFFVANALHWIDEYHLDGFRLDAIHAIKDLTAQPFLREMTEAVHTYGARHGRHVHVIAESIMNHPIVCNPDYLGGFGMDSEWNDDFHHALHAFVTGENTGYYGDFGSFGDLVTAYRSGFVYTGRHMGYRGRRHGDVARLYDGPNFVVFAQDHDQVGNRAQGDRLSTMVSFEMQKTIAAVVILSPYLPMLFMGEDYGETVPFQYFVDHSDPDLIEAVRNGRRSEFESFAWQGEVPDPQAPETFERSKLRHDRKTREPCRSLWRWHQALFTLRRSSTALAELDMQQMEVVQYQAERILFVRRWTRDDEVCQIISLGRDRSATLFPVPEGSWDVVLDSADTKWSGPGSDIPDEPLNSGGEIALVVGPARSLVLRRSADS
ncbi:MAG: malto-oligosyltrehalose trehalohydrolase [Chloroflexota bacterium]